MEFSVIVPVRNRPEEIRACVASLYRIDFPPTEYEVIVVDNGSTDETARAAMQSGARVISEREPNRCLARNLGAKVARGRWLAFTDSDCEVDKGWLKEFAQAERRIVGGDDAARVGILAGAIRPGPARSTVEAYIAARKWIDQEKFLSSGRPHSPPFAATANLAIRADVFREVGEFDPKLSVAGEDADWCWRAAELGWGIQYVPDAAVIHHHRISTKNLMRQSFNYGLGNADLFSKYRDKWNAKVSIEPRRYAWALKGLLKSPVTYALGGDDLAMKSAWYDFLSNTAQAYGRFVGGVRNKTLVI